MAIHTRIYSPKTPATVRSVSIRKAINPAALFSTVKAFKYKQLGSKIL